VPHQIEATLCDHHDLTACYSAQSAIAGLLPEACKNAITEKIFMRKYAVHCYCFKGGVLATYDELEQQYKTQY